MRWRRRNNTSQIEEKKRRLVGRINGRLKRGEKEKWKMRKKEDKRNE
jgi:hypothetical protein